MIDEPPLFAGALQDADIKPFAGESCRFVGASGAVKTGRGGLKGVAD